MATRSTQYHATEGISRRQLLQTSLAAGATLAAWPLYHPATIWGAEAGYPSAGGSCAHAAGIRHTLIRI